MYDAYAKIEVAKKIFNITSLAAHPKTDKVYTGLNNGSLLGFERPDEQISRRGHECRVFRQFEKKPVVDLQFIEPLNLLICLAGGQVTAHSINEKFDVCAVIDKYPVITAFSAHVTEKENKLFVAVSAKHQLHIFKLLLNDFEEINIQFDPPTLLGNFVIIRWCSEHSIYFSSRNEYLFVQVFVDEETGDRTNLGRIRAFAGRQDGPIVVLPDRKVVGICRSTAIEFYTAGGNKDHTIPNVKFEEQPISLVYDAPYLIAALPNNVVEIRSVLPSMVIQKLSFDKPRFLSVGPRGTVYVSGSDSVFELTSKPLLKQNIENLLEDNQFDLASQLADFCETLTKQERTRVKRKTAAAYFAQKRFEECFKIHKDEKTDILLLLHFMPDLIPAKFQTKADQYTKDAYDFMPEPDFAQNEKKQAEIELSDFLSEMRTEHATILEKHRQKQITLSTSEFKHHEAVLELADTVLLKCYLRTKQSMVPSLLRLSHNNCNVEEAASDLRNAERFDDLYLLYSKKNIRRKALAVLKVQGQKEESPYYGPEETVSYLQTFGPAHFDLIKEYSVWVLETNPELGVKIFATNECEAVRDLNREQVLVFLTEECVPAVIPYLEHIIFEWRDTRQTFHEQLALMYIAKVKRLMNEFVLALGDNEGLPRAGEEEGELGKFRSKLISFLNYSTSYNPAAIESQLNDNLMHEKAIVFGRLGRHEESLLIYANILMDYDMAENHCEKYYSDTANTNIFVTLFKAYTNPPLLPSFKMLQKRIKYAHPKVAEALKLLAKHPTQLDPVEALQLLSSQTPLQQVWPALEAVLEALKNKATSIEIHTAVSQLTLQKAEANLRKLKSEKIVVDEKVTCYICNKVIDSAFVRWKDGRLSHHSCYTKHGTDYITNFRTNQEVAMRPVLERRMSRNRTISLI